MRSSYKQFLCLLILTAAVIFSPTALSKQKEGAQTCAPVPTGAWIGPELSNASLVPSNPPHQWPLVPFESTEAWKALKQMMQEGDVVHQFRDSYRGGYFVVRNGCLVSEHLSYLF